MPACALRCHARSDVMLTLGTDLLADGSPEAGETLLPRDLLRQQISKKGKLHASACQVELSLCGVLRLTCRGTVFSKSSVDVGVGLG